jgi:2-dehydro-3-deoxygalactonokinase
MNNLYLLGCDWGSSSFRLKLFNIAEQKVEGEINTKEGIVNTFKLWQVYLKKEANPISREHFFKQKLKNNLGLLAEQLSKDLNHIPIMISGMASSSIGMLDVAYSDLPYSLDGSTAVTVTIAADNDFQNDIILISTFPVFLKMIKKGFQKLQKF